jgi:hypothetical protein
MSIKIYPRVLQLHLLYGGRSRLVKLSGRTHFKMRWLHCQKMLPAFSENEGCIILTLTDFNYKLRYCNYVSYISDYSLTQPSFCGVPCGRATCCRCLQRRSSSMQQASSLRLSFSSTQRLVRELLCLPASCKRHFRGSSIARSSHVHVPLGLISVERLYCYQYRGIWLPSSSKAMGQTLSPA